MGGWFEGLIHFIRGESHEITFISKFWAVLGGGVGLSWRVGCGGGYLGVRALLFSVGVSVGFVRVRCMEVAALLLDWRPLGAPRGVR